MPRLLQTTLYALILLTTLTEAAPSKTGISLELKLNVPSTITDVSKFTISGSLTNTASQTLNIIKDPVGPLLSGFAPDAFQFKKTGGRAEEPEFDGVVPKWSLDSYLRPAGEAQSTGPDGEPLEGSKKDKRAGDDSSDEGTGSTGSPESVSSEETSIDGSSDGGRSKYNNPPKETIHELEKGKKLEFTYDVGDAYDFTKAGPGEYQVDLRRKTFFVLVDGDIQEITVDVKPSTVKIDGTLAAKEDDVSDPSKREITTKKCNAIESLVIGHAAERADKYVKDSIGYLAGMSAPTDRYKHWFGDWEAKATDRYDYAPKDQVKSLYEGLRPFQAPGNQGGYTYDCSCDYNIYAYARVRLTRPVINLCRLFRSTDTPYEGENSKAGILVQQASVFPTGKGSHAYMIEEGREDCHDLAERSPHRAAVNADSYEFFSENVNPTKE